MLKLYTNFISSALSIAPWQVEHTVELIDEGATIPFISRYRKERTGNLDEIQIAEIKHYNNRFIELDQRKKSIIDSLTKQELLTPELEKSVKSCVDLQLLEDIYLPYKPKRRTRAMIAKEKGLEPLAFDMFDIKISSPTSAAAKYLNENVKNVNDALSGAMDIIAEKISEIATVRATLRTNFQKYGRIQTKLAKGIEDDSEQVDKYKNYVEFSEPISKSPSHRILAMLRGASEGILNVKIHMDSEITANVVYDEVFHSKPRASRDLYNVLHSAVEDSFKRLLAPSIENEVLKIAKAKADLESIKVFGENLRQLLMAPPLGQKRVLAIDPGFRTGCKVVCLDAQGALLHNDTIYPHPPVNERTMAMKKISNMVEAYKIEVIAIGNGTAGRETEAFIKKLALPEGIKVYSISEDGASVYSASDIARKEFPEYDVTVRGAVSIGRRIMDPLAELVKIDPKSIGVGQYQHDVDQTLLKESLDNVVESCVNTVGVNLNTASDYLLSYVSGIGPSIAKNIVDYRNENGAFISREQLKKVKRLGDKAYEQCAAFLRIPNAKNPLDNSAVHPESYHIVAKMAKDKKSSIEDLITNKDLRDTIDLSAYVSDNVGLPTLNDIISELAKPGRDPRASIKILEFSDEIKTIEDLVSGMELPGIITNITNFGAFVDLGIKQKGLIHISQLSDSFVSNPADIVKIHQHVQIQVLEVDSKRNRIALKLIK